MKKLTSWLLIAVLSTTMLTACTPDGPSDGTATTTTTTTTAGTTAGDGGAVTTETDAETEETFTSSAEEPDSGPTTVVAETDETTEMSDPVTTVPDVTEPVSSADGGDGTVEGTETDWPTDPDATDEWTGGPDIDSFLGGLDSLQINKKADGSVEMILPPDLVDDETMDELNSGEGDFGEVEYTQNADGSVTIMLTKEQHQEFLQELREGAVAMFEELSEAFVSFQDLEISDDMQQFTVLVDGDTWSEDAVFGFLGFTITSFVYQIYDGVKMDDMKLELKVVDDETGEVLYDMNEMPEE